MQLITEKERAANEVRTKLADNEYLRKQQSLLSDPGTSSADRFRIHEFTSAVMMLPDFHNYNRIRPLIDGLINEVNPKDFLGCSAALEIMAEIAAARKENIQYFEQIGLLEKIYDLFKFTKQNPDMGLLHIACIRFFGYLSTADPNSLIKFPLFMQDVFDAVNRFDSFDLVRRKLAFETLAIITTTSGAKEYLVSNDCPYNMNKAMNHLGAAVATGSGIPQLKANYLGAIKTIFDSFGTPRESEHILHHWFIQLGQPFPRLLLQCVQTVLPELQVASLELLLSLMQHKWAPAYFCTLDGFMDFLMGRDQNFTAIGYQMKHDLVCRLLDSNSPLIDSETMQKLRNYAAKGPYANQERLEVATEEAN